MAMLLALTATVLTSWLPVATKLMVRDARPEVVAWAINLASLPLLLAGTLLLTVGAVPQVDGVFALALLCSAVLNWGATLFSTRALASADASLVGPLLTFNPLVTLLVAWPVLGEAPGVREAAGVGVLILGAYLLELEAASKDALAPLRTLTSQPGTRLALAAGALWGVTTVLEKIAIQHARPPSGPLVAFASTAITVALLTPAALRREPAVSKRGVLTHPWLLGIAIVIAGVAPLFGFSAIALGFVGYVTALFKLSAVLTVVWARLVLHEGHLRQRLLGTSVMLAGGALIAL
jgi:drug/metabolite transporter (DMT)-like permease